MQHFYNLIVTFFLQVGLAMGSLCIINGAAYLVDSVLSVIFIVKTKMNNSGY